MAREPRRTILIVGEVHNEHIADEFLYNHLYDLHAQNFRLCCTEFGIHVDNIKKDNNKFKKHFEDQFGLRFYTAQTKPPTISELQEAMIDKFYSKKIARGERTEVPTQKERGIFLLQNQAEISRVTNQANEFLLGEKLYGFYQRAQVLTPAVSFTHIDLEKAALHKRIREVYNQDCEGKGSGSGPLPLLTHDQEQRLKTERNKHMHTRIAEELKKPEDGNVIVHVGANHAVYLAQALKLTNPQDNIVGIFPMLQKQAGKEEDYETTQLYLKMFELDKFGGDKHQMFQAISVHISHECARSQDRAATSITQTEATPAVQHEHTLDPRSINTGSKRTI